MPEAEVVQVLQLAFRRLSVWSYHPGLSLDSPWTHVVRMECMP